MKRKADTKYVSTLSADKKPEIRPAYMHKAPGDDTLTLDSRKIRSSHSFDLTLGHCSSDTYLNQPVISFIP
jgi:hypothetical protein